MTAPSSRPMGEMNSTFDIVVIGAGPGGYVAAIHAAQMGLHTACVEREDRLGGTCLRVGCIPSKALLESSERYAQARESLAAHGVRVSGVKLDLAAMQARKDEIVRSLTEGIAYLFSKNHVARFAGQARIAGPGKVVVTGSGAETTLEAKNIIIATGSRPAPLPGVQMESERIGTSTDALAYAEVPRRLAVIGAGYIGLELGSVWRRLGSDVTVLEFMPRILPGMDSGIAADARTLLERQGLKIVTGARVQSAVQDGEVCRVTCDGMEPLECDRVLLAAGRVPETTGLGLAEAQVRTAPKGFVLVDENFQTSLPGVYAIGDVAGGPMLAHKAMDEGVACVDGITGRPIRMNYSAIPGVVYTHPEIASAGKTEDALRESGQSYRKGVFHLRANGRARCLGETDGMVKILADAATDRLLGVHIIGAHAGDLIAEAATAIAFGASAEDLALVSHAHPTLAEALKEAALASRGQAMHE